MMSASGAKDKIFFDNRGRRDRRVRLVCYLFVAIGATLGAVSIASAFINSQAPRLELRRVDNLPNASELRSHAPPSPVRPREQRIRLPEAVLRQAQITHSFAEGQKALQSRAIKAASNRNADKPLSIGFYVNWDDSSYHSLKSHLAQLDWVVPQWIRLQSGGEAVSEIDPHDLQMIRRQRPDIPILPMIHNSNDGVWDVPALANALADRVSRRRVIDFLTQFVEANDFQGVCVDFEHAPAASQPNLLLFMQELRLRFQSYNWLVTMIAPFDDPAWDYRAYAATTDYLMLAAHDEHWARDDPGSVCGQSWFEATLAERMRELDGAKTIVCIGAYGYDWSPGGEPTGMTFQDAMLKARDSKTRIVFDPMTRNPYFYYEDEGGAQHTVWFLDAVTAFNQIRLSRAFHPAGFALWRLGSEDPSLWAVFGNAQLDMEAPEASENLREIGYAYDVDLRGMGEILQVEAEPEAGRRAVDVDTSRGLITDERYTAIPSTYVIHRTSYSPGLVVLTFDDGPDPRWTPRILDILKREEVPAAFFIIGQNGLSHPALVKRIAAEGHDIGNHTYLHQNSSGVSEPIIDLELNLTQRLIESITGRSTRLFRSPYSNDTEPDTIDGIKIIHRAERLGYVTIGSRVDPKDWTLPGAEELVKRVINGVTHPDPDVHGQVVLLHDSGGDRSQTVEALPRLIQELRARGYRFVTVSELAGLTQDQTMPPARPEHRLFTMANRITFYSLANIGWGIHWLFIFGIALGLARIFFLGAIALLQKLRRRRPITTAEPREPFVSIIVPAYNEERVIAQTVRSLLSSDYPNFEVIVVDDGSSDRTREVAREHFGDEPRVQLLTQPNLGKAEALNVGWRRARGEIIVALDADTIFMPATIGALVRRFDDPQVGAVAGNAKVGNRINMVTRWQALEYVTAQNLDRRAFTKLNCVFIVSGAVGAWRRDLLELLGGFSSDTLAEDQDLTIRVRKSGYRVEYAEDAVAWTEAPDTVRTLARQRLRWSFGTLQCMWKHRDALFRRRYGALGFVAMPNVWIFQIFFPLISPLIDLTIVWTLFIALLERLGQPAEYASANLNRALFSYLLFFAVDLLASAFAFLLEKREQWSLLWRLFLQRFCYRQVMFYVIIKSTLMALRGVNVGWGKIERKATVEL